MGTNIDQSVRPIFLSEPDMLKAGVMDMKGCLDAVEAAFKLIGKGDYLMGGPSENDHGHLIWFPPEKRFEGMPVAGPDRRFMAMIAYLGGEFKTVGVKWYGSNIENREKGLPRSIHTIILNDPDTSKPLAIMSGNLLSQMRTGAVPGVASKHLGRQGSNVVGIIGAGIIGRTALIGICEAMKTIKKVKVYDVFETASQKFKEIMEESLEVEVEIVDSIQSAVEGCDIINVAASGIKLPEIDTRWMKKGSTLLLIGAADFLDAGWEKNNVIYADNWKMHQVLIEEMKGKREGVFEEVLSWAPSAPVLLACYNGNITDSDVKNLGDVVNGKVQARTSNEDKIIFATCGMMVEDVAWGCRILENAKANGIGQELKYWDKHYWL